MHGRKAKLVILLWKVIIEIDFYPHRLIHFSDNPNLSLMSRRHRVVSSFCIISRLRAPVEHLLQFGGKISDRPGTRTQNLQLRKLTRCHYANPPRRLLLPQKPHGGLEYHDHGPK